MIITSSFINKYDGHFRIQQSFAINSPISVEEHCEATCLIKCNTLQMVLLYSFTLAQTSLRYTKLTP